MNIKETYIHLTEDSLNFYFTVEKEYSFENENLELVDLKENCSKLLCSVAEDLSEKEKERLKDFLDDEFTKEIVYKRN